VRVLGIVWVGIRTADVPGTVGFFRDVLGVPMEMITPDFGWSRMPNTSQLEVFGAAEADHQHFTTGPVPEFLVDDLPAAVAELRAAGVEILGTPSIDGRDGWCQFRGPDGVVYGLAAGDRYWRPSTE
jgi:predicted enzyme related to lactoylglutathione lyase